MAQARTHAVTGAFGYSGKYIARKLLDRGQRVITLTNSTGRANPFGADVEAFPMCFDRPDELTGSLRGVRVLHNTYWVRFNHRRFSHRQAIENTLTLFRCARAAGVERVVHVSITNPSIDSPFEYFRGKAILEAALAESGLSHTILRPAVLFGNEDVLINNIAWVLRRLPVFGVPGDGSYRIQPIHVEDLADLAAAGSEESRDAIIEAIGPETFTFRELVAELARILAVSRTVLSVPPWLALQATRAIGLLVGDVVLTSEEIGGLMAGTLAVDAEPAGRTRLTDWARQNREELGRRYASELGRR